MPFCFEPSFTRQLAAQRPRIGLVIPPSATVSASLSAAVRKTAEAIGPPTVLPNRFSFHYVDRPTDANDAILADDAVVDSGIYTFPVKDAVIAVFDMARWGNQEFCWSFSSNAQRDVLAALHIGHTFDVKFDEPLGEAFHVLRHHFPPGVPQSGYGEYAIHLAVDQPRPDGFRVVSSFEPQSTRTDSRLPFFFGFRVFGNAVHSPPLPTWRALLSAAVHQSAHERWAHCLLYAAFSLEAFIDRQLADRLSAAGLGDDYVNSALRAVDRRSELSALNSINPRLTQSGVKALTQRLDNVVFTPRNRLAHGNLTDAAVDSDMAVSALKTVIEFFWDWDRESRPLLVTPMHQSSFEALIDEPLLAACRS